MDNQKIKVLYIAGSGRSGSTILQNILKQIDGFYSINEVHSVWKRDFMKNQQCGCRQLFNDCEWWRSVRRQSPELFSHLDAEQMYRLTESFRIKDLPTTLVPGMRSRQLARLQGYLKALEKFYEAIHSSTNSRVIVDDSKNPAYGYLVAQVPSVDMYILHFVRDARSVAYSWAKKKPFVPGPNPEYMKIKGPVLSALQWDARNISTEVWLRRASKQYLQMHYEDFVTNPRQTVERILAFVGESTAELPFLTDHRVEICKPNHSIFGNIVRFQTGVVDIKLDEEWKQKMSRINKTAATLFTLPLMSKYGYLSMGKKGGH